MTVNVSQLEILVLDDHLIIRQAIEKNLKAMGFSRIDMVGDTNEAQGKLDSKKYDIIFVDWLLPGKSGYALMQECRQDRKFDDVAFVMVTSENDKHHMIEAIKAGATAYIIKPVTPETFKEKVEKVLEWIDKRKTAGAQRSSG
ncbi:MAG: response regulator [Alphaproteobacteria bacterium]|nr:MAG: response regulator [Alphaproteobacteria bacterium]